MMFVEEGMEVLAAAGFVEAGCSDDDELLALAEALGVDGGAPQIMQTAESLVTSSESAISAGNRTEGLVGEGGVEAGEDDALAEVDELEGERDEAVVEELNLVDTDDFDLVDAIGLEELGLEAVELGVTTAASWVCEEWLAMAVRW